MYDLQRTLDLDAFAGRTGGKRGRSIGRDSSLGHYIGKIPMGVVLVIHSSFSERANDKLIVCKALSKFICTSSITRNADKVILVRKSSVFNAFGYKLRGRVMSSIGIAKAVDEENVNELVESVQTGLLSSKRRRKMAKERIKRLGFS